MKRLSGITGLAAALLVLASATGASAFIRVPADQATIAAALGVAVSGDEIRVANTFTETSTGNAISGKTITIRSYDATYTTATTGAKWLPAVASTTTSGIIVLTNSASLTFDGFSQVAVGFGNGIYTPNVAGSGTGCSATVTNTNFTTPTTTSTASYAAIFFDQGSNCTVSISNCNFTDNGRGLYFNRITGTTSMDVSNCNFTYTSSTNNFGPIEYRPGTGTSTFSISNCAFSIFANQPVRLWFFTAVSGTPINVSGTVDRCKFTAASTTLVTPLVIAGTTAGVSIGSSADVLVKNCIFDMRSGNTAGGCLSGLADATLVRTVNLTAQHCTFLLNAASQFGFGPLKNDPGTFSIQNSIIDGTGIALKNDGTGTASGTITSGKNLFNTTSTSTGTGPITLSGSEIISTSPQFVSSSDFHLQNASPAINVGTSSTVTTDYDGNTRPFGSAPDLGAYENQSVTAVADWTILDLE